MEKRHSTSERVVNITGSIFLTIAFVTSLILNGDETSVLELIPIDIGRPLTSVILPIAYGCLALYGFVLVFLPSTKAQVFICYMSSIITMLTNYEFLAVFLFLSSIIIYLLICPYSKKKRICIIFMAIFHYLSILCVYPHGWIQVLYVFCTSVFFMVLHIWLYYTLRQKFSSFLQNKVYENQVIKEKPGEILNLKDYGLTDRQVSLTKEYFYNKMPYKDLADKYITSLSSIKKEFSCIFQKLGVSDISEMVHLLQQFQLKK